MKLEVGQRETDHRDYFREIIAELNEAFNGIKAANPTAYLDEFESRMEGLLVDAVSTRGGCIEFYGDTARALFLV